MQLADRIKEIVTTYRKHGWQLRRVLLMPSTRTELAVDELDLEGAAVEESTINALWFSRASLGKRKAWELRLISETPYALFETFEEGDAEEACEQIRREMVARLGEFRPKRDF